jgi:high-affinity iron transporter
MFPTATIVFREFLEIALVLSIILAATQGLPKRSYLIYLGIAVGVFGSLLIAFFTNTISEAIDGVGQEIFNATIMFIAVGFLSWTVIWMKRHARELSQNIKKAGQEVLDGTRPAYTISVVVALATFREGAEIALFTYGMSASGQYAVWEILVGGLIGAVGGSIVGLMIYFGLLKATKKHLFSVTGWLLILLTAGMAAKGASFLIAADILPSLHPEVWNTSNFISSGSFLGEMLGVLVGYTPRPTGTELLFYLAIIVSVGGAYISSGNPKKQST